MEKQIHPEMGRREIASTRRLEQKIQSKVEPTITGEWFKVQMLVKGTNL